MNVGNRGGDQDTKGNDPGASEMVRRCHREDVPFV